MPDILFDLPIAAPPVVVYEAIATPQGLERWWALRASGEPRAGARYSLDFGPQYQWEAVCRRAEPAHHFELELTRADDDWISTRLLFELAPPRRVSGEAAQETGTSAPPMADSTQLRFAHLGWPQVNEHYRVSSFCWAMYLRLLRRHLEAGELVPYERRLEV